MKKVLIISAISILSLAVIILAAGYGLISYLDTPTGSKKALAEVQKILAKDFSTELQYSSANILLLSKFQINDLKVVSTYGGNHIVVSIRSLNAEYALQLLQRKINVRKLVVNDSHFNVQLKQASSSQSDKNKQTTSESGSGPELVSRLIRHPPLEVSVDEIQVNDLNGQLSAKIDERQVNLDLKHIQLQSNFEWIKNQFTSHIHILVPEENAFSIRNSKSRISGLWTLNTDLKMRMNYRDDSWEYQFNAKPCEMQLNNLGLEQIEEGVQRRLTKFSRLTLTSTTELKLTSKEFLKFDSGSVKIADDHTQILVQNISTVQLTGAKKVLLSIASQNLEITSQLQKKVQLSLQVHTLKIQSPEKLSSPIDFEARADFSVAPDLNQAEGHFQSFISKNEFVSGQIGLNRSNPDANWNLEASSKLIVHPLLAKKIKGASGLEKMGVVTIDSQLKANYSKEARLNANLKVEVPQILLPLSKTPFKLSLSSNLDWQKNNFSGQADVNTFHNEFGNWQIHTESQGNLSEISGKSSIVEVKFADPTLLPVSFTKPVMVTHHFKSEIDNMHGEVKASIPIFEIERVGTIRDTRFELSLVGDHMNTEKNVSIKATFDQGPVELANRLNPSGVRIGSMKMNAAAQIRNQTQFSLTQFQFSLNEELVKLSAEASANLKTFDLQAQAETRISFPDDFPEVFGQKLKGDIKIPFRVSVRRGQDIMIDGSMNFKNLSITKQDMAVEGFNGEIPFSEHLIRNGTQIHFSHLVTQNAFERVNFERLRPLLQSADQFSIQKIRWQEKTFGPLLGFFSVDQNMIVLHEFNLALGTGSLYGEMFLDAFPQNLQFGLLSRITGLDLAQVLPKKFLNRIPDGNKTISARTGFVFSINKAILNGRVDVTQIGSAQMITLINLLDPEFIDDKMNKLRNLLEIGYPTAVAMNFNQGYLDLDVELRALGISQHEAVRSIPLSEFLLKPTADIVSATQKGPLR